MTSPREAAEPRHALRDMLASGRRHPVPGVGRQELVTAMDALRDEAIAALVARGLPPADAADSLADIPRKLELYGELVDVDWLLAVFTGQVVTLGRLQFEVEPEGAGRSIHIPETGPLTPASVDDAIARAAEWFGDDVPLVCDSWVFDDRLRDLPATSNLRRFIERFDVPPTVPDLEGARSLAKFVFRSTPARVTAAPLRPNANAVERIAYAALAGDGLWSKPLATLR
ncbi:hypothetical protein [Leifsonia sp. fls2-241-R2A-40a]|uniref:hypothetical protein n=1 Tax=Leifsonia sp. fls2-241-R2A-40a TaxID=3040290 RepID=UPI00254ABE9E|nr:hypothetical protein [Leifsonia sp. fls2-241-R2A-40a]